ncbi:MAG: alpha/beta fold hydrolase [Candidatus Hydrogenedentes bacterium]|nr:alpha/beta fold hydrolase [Candidatus Hydrogenedentota bacterium]
MRSVEELVAISCGSDSMEGILAYPEKGVPAFGVMLLSPHPHMGGNMENNVIRHIARRAAEACAATLRFNYRGVGQSSLRSEGGGNLYEYWARVERDREYDRVLPDVLAAWDWFKRSLPKNVPRVLLGYSLGAVLAGMVASRLDAVGIVSVSPPASRVPLRTLCSCKHPMLITVGDNDFACEVQDVRSAIFDTPISLEVITGADHFYRGLENSLGDVLARYDWGRRIPVKERLFP